MTHEQSQLSLAPNPAIARRAPFSHCLLQAGHRAAIIATLVLTAAVLAVLLNASGDRLAWAAVFAADTAIVVCGFLLLRAYRVARRKITSQEIDHAATEVADSSDPEQESADSTESATSVAALKSNADETYTRPVPQIVALLLFSLLIAHAAGYLLLTHFESVSAWRTQPLLRPIVQTDRK